MIYYKFVQHEPAPIEKVMNASIPSALKAYDDGNELPFKALQIVTRDPFYQLGGWRFDLRPYLKKYWVKEKYYGILEYYAPSKTAIRNELKSRCIKIVEVD